MYGLIFENFSGYIKVKYGEEAWDNVRRLANIDTPTFSIHHVYPEVLLGKIAKKTFTTLGCNADEFFEGMGYYFVELCSKYGYGDVLALLGRELRDFLNGLDNLHEYLKFSYPRLRAPSYFVDNETPEGLMLHYRSKRRGFTNYTVGQLKAVSETYYKTEIQIEVKDSQIKFDTVFVSFQLTFDNKSKVVMNSNLVREEARLPAVSSSVLFEIFPFIIVFGEDMVVQSIGRSLTQILPKLVGAKMNDYFDVVRPLIEFKFDNILSRSNNIFELMTNEPIDKLLKSGGALGGEEEGEGNEENLMEEEVDNFLHLKGQMNFMADWNVVMFLCSPALKDLQGLSFSGLFICDLSMHDFSRDLLLAGSQQSNDLKGALESEMEKTKLMEESMAKLDEEMKRSDQLLAQMMPKSVSEKVKNGASTVETCEIFESVTIVFNDIPVFGDICAKCDGMSIVLMLNVMFGIFDNLSDRNQIYKVETVKDCFVGVCGAPERNNNHAERIMDMAMDMRDCVQFVPDPRPGVDSHIKIRLGSSSGQVVGGIVGNKCPRYCLFGDAMNTSSRMMSFSEEQCIHVSGATKELLPPAYSVKERGKMMIKGKGEMVTYWVESKANRVPPTKDEVYPQEATKPSQPAE
ncbi:soluble guanylate cyclase 88E [Eurytemora carolleeae]|uniref:soluble guanylate cyclase 88E n=1 Tax=Eurytemora carolleeae TaxID=1294199 RepID=UPI000C78A5E8|nr:soluble guanylate cyclase 88E [Eurytemora carolleeae]|eukprot:XP_023336260.1 soluble guanylate cyclase 88E-like [Eurytemora affinis]